MLTTTKREVINNDFDRADARELKTFAQHSLYSQQDVQDVNFDRQYEPVRQNYSTEINNSYAPVQIAKKLYGENCDTRELRSYEEQLSRTYGRTNDFSNPDLMPSRTTMNYPTKGYEESDLEGRYIAEEKTETRQRTKLAATSTKTKILIASYVAVVLALVLIITLVAVSISSLFSQVSALESELSEQIVQTQLLEQQVNDAASYEVIVEKAQNELNMIIPEGLEIQAYETPQTKDIPSFIAPTNAFDRFTTWLSGLFGG